MQRMQVPSTSQITRRRSFIRASVMCDCVSRTRDFCLGLASCAVTTPGRDSKQLL
ncbi:hypothetical protein J6590_062126, partial [Homalodisca vitripennis]